MLKIIKHLKPFKYLVLVIIGLLFIQANSDLALPEYMSKIVNVGIQQNGIENSAIKVISKDEYLRLSLFLNEKEIKFINKNYKEISKDLLTDKEYKDYLKKYPLLKTNSLYVLDTRSSKDIDKVSTILGKNMLIVYQLESGKVQTGDIAIPEGMDMFDLLAVMPNDKKELILESINSKVSGLSDSIITQTASIYIKNEYKEVGLDSSKMQSDYIFMAGLKMLGIALISMIASISVGFIGAKVAAGLGRNLRKNLFTKVESFSNVEFDKFGASSLITRTTNDIQQVQSLLVMLLRIVFYAPLLGVGGVLKVLATDASMTWIIGAAVGAIVVLVAVLFIFAIPKFKLVQKLIDKLNLVTRESLTGMLVIRAFNNEKHEEKKFSKANKDLKDTNLFINRAMAIMFPMMMLIMNVVTILIVWVGAHQIGDGVIQVGDMMAFIQYTMQIIMSFLMITMVSIMIPRAAVAATRVDEVLSTKPIINDKEATKKLPSNIKGNIKFENVSFKYSDADACVINNINFEAKPGETTALIGSTGSGKSTIINLIPRFYDVTSGSITIDGIDIRDLKQHDLRENIGYIPQKGLLFSGTIESNLKYGKDNATKKEIEKAASIAQATNFINEKEDNFNYEIAQGGTNVSGGQRQRLSIARALAKDSKIYIFDDTFSALDFKTDSLLRQALKKEVRNKTILIVAQRVSTIMNAEQIIVLDNGEIVGKGTHEYLMKNCQVYQEIALSQLSEEELV